jgi:putative oxidoreductase
MAWVVLRLLLAGLIAAHGWVRLLGGGVVPFGGWLTSQDVPIGLGIAAGVTAIEILGTPPFALGLFVPALAIVYAGIYTVGLFMVHLPEGWFVVGSGRNGAEYSVLLIVCLLCVGAQHLPAPRRRG